MSLVEDHSFMEDEEYLEEVGVCTEESVDSQALPRSDKDTRSQWLQGDELRFRTLSSGEV